MQTRRRRRYLSTMAILAALALPACADWTPEERMQSARILSQGFQSIGSQMIYANQPRPMTYTNCYRTIYGVQCQSW